MEIRIWRLRLLAVSSLPPMKEDVLQIGVSYPRRMIQDRSLRPISISTGAWIFLSAYTAPMEALRIVKTRPFQG